MLDRRVIKILADHGLTEDDITPTGWVAFYDDEAGATALAKALKAPAKHCGLRGNPFFQRFSIVKVREPDWAFLSQKRRINRG